MHGCLMQLVNRFKWSRIVDVMGYPAHRLKQKSGHHESINMHMAQCGERTLFSLSSLLLHHMYLLRACLAVNLEERGKQQQYQ